MPIDFFTPVPKSRSIKLRGKKGVIFNNLGFTKKTLFYVSNYVFVGSILYLLYLYGPLIKAVISFWSSENPVEIANVIPSPYPTPPFTKGFRLEIPKIKANSEVVENVSPFNKQEYLKVLENNKVAEAKGSNVPGAGNGTSQFIFAHSTEQGFTVVRNNSVFYLLGELKNGDEVFLNKDEKVYKYLVYDRKIVGAKQTEYLNYSEPDKEILILQTCWPIGTDWKRLLILAKKVEK